MSFLRLVALDELDRHTRKLADELGADPRHWPWRNDTSEGIAARQDFEAQVKKRGPRWAMAYLSELAAQQRSESLEIVVRGISRRELEREYEAIAARGKRPSRPMVARALGTSEATLERACKEGLECHPWPGSLKVDPVDP